MIRTTLTALVALLVVSSLAVAPASAASLSITGVSLPNSVSQGDSFDVQVDVSGSDVQNVEASLSLPDGLSCSPSGTQSVSLDSDGNGQAIFDCEAEATGDYRGEITASVTADETSSSNTRSDSTQTGLEVLSPASLSLTTMTGSTSLTVGDSTTLDVIVENSGDASTSYTVSVASSDGYSTTVTSGSTSGEIAGDSTATISLDLTADSGGDYTLTVNASGGNGQSLSESHLLSLQSSGGGGASSSTTSTETTTATTTATSTATPADNATETMTDDGATTGTATVTATPTADLTEAGDAEQMNADPGTSDGSGPGFGFLSALAAIAAVGLGVMRRP